MRIPQVKALRLNLIRIKILGKEFMIGVDAGMVTFGLEGIETGECDIGQLGLGAFLMLIVLDINPDGVDTGIIFEERERVRNRVQHFLLGVCSGIEVDVKFHAGFFGLCGTALIEGIESFVLIAFCVFGIVFTARKTQYHEFDSSCEDLVPVDPALKLGNIDAVMGLELGIRSIGGLYTGKIRCKYLCMVGRTTE